MIRAPCLTRQYNSSERIWEMPEIPNQLVPVPSRDIKNNFGFSFVLGLCLRVAIASSIRYWRFEYRTRLNSTLHVVNYSVTPPYSM